MVLKLIFPSWFCHAQYCRGGGSRFGEEEVGVAVPVLATLLFNSGDDGVDVIGFGQEAFFVFCKRPRNYYLPDQAELLSTP